MNLKDLQRYKSLYRLAAGMGAGRIFNQYFGFDEHRVVPLSVSHGIDFGHCFGPMDVNNIEPIHWSYNEKIYEQAVRVKPSLLAPHPWTMLVANKDIPEGQGVLVIGPPPGLENDQALYELIKHDIRDDWSILVKQRGDHEKSMAFWREKGVGPVTAGGSDSDFYGRLYNLLSGYKTICGCTFSSALIFAASIGKRVDLVEGYWHRTYEVAEYASTANWESNQSKSVVKSFLSGNQQVIQNVSRALLGFHLCGNRPDQRAEFGMLIKGLHSPFHPSNEPSLVMKARLALALAFDKPGLLSLDMKAMQSRFFRNRKIVEMKINEFEAFANSPTPDNLMLTPTPYIKGRTEPGAAVIGY